MKTISAGLAGAVLISFAAAAAAGTPMILPQDAGPAAPKAFSDTPMRFNRAGLELLKPGADIELTLPSGSRHDYVFEQAIDHGGGFKTWIARSPLTGTNERAIITSGPGGAWGWMKTRYGDYRIYPSGKGYDLVARRERINVAPKFKGGDAREVGPDDPSIAPLKGVSTMLPEPVSKSITAKVTPTPAFQSDVMILYTRDLAQKLGVGLMPMIYNLIASTNTAYADSEVAISLRLVNATMIDWPNTNASDDTLDGMNGAGAHAAFFQNLTWGGPTSLRNTVGADFVALVRDGPTDTGGIGNLPKNPVVYPAPPVVGSSSAYSVNNFCATGCEGIFAHELGHNMGNHHDPATIAYDVNGAFNPALSAHQGVFPYSYGYYSCATGLTCNPYTPGGGCTNYAECAGSDPNDFGTIMSYFQPKIMKFSNPLLANCEPTGAPGAARACGGSVTAPPAPATTSNNALSMNNVREVLSAYRNQTIANLPGSLQFTALSYSGAEGATLTFTVSRANGSSGAVTVNYTVTAGTATAGSDYTVANGFLSWANGEAANKVINVTLAADAVVEGVETFTATLSTPTGAPGVYIGYPNAATGLIIEPWPDGTLGGIPTVPTGSWSSPASPASSVPWSIVNEAPPGDPGGRSLKSGALNFGTLGCTDPTYGPTPCPSTVELTRNFSAGTVAFSYRVSAFTFFGMLEFLVDGTVVHAAQGNAANAANGGDTGWQFFSTPITAGNHTLTWRYRTRLGFPCGAPGATVGGVSYPGCQDRAWIDQLALPANTAFANPPRLGNISTRMQVLTGDNVMIAGFVIGGSTNKDVAVVVTGPSLAAYGITNPLANPTMTLVRSSDQSVVAINDNWGSAPNAAALQAAGFAPTNSQEAGLLVNLAPGAYTAIVQGVGGGVGVAVAAVYEVSGPEIPLTNISTRGRVGAGGDVMIGGFVIQGTGPQQVAIVATGPSLAQYGITSPLANPTLTLVRSSDQTTIAVNDDWGTATNASALQTAGFAPTNPLEAAILTTLQPGAYTAIVQGAGGGVGVAVVGVYRVP